MRVLITGADGFVGRHAVREFQILGWEVVPVAGPDDGRPLPFEGRRIVLDESSKLSAEITRTQPDAILHLAGASSVGQSHVRPDLAFHSNLLGTLHVLEAVRASGPQCRVLVVSSAEVYGNQADCTPRREDAPTCPLHPYGASKLAAEILALQYERAYGLQVLIVRPFNHIGTGQAPHFLLPSLARQFATAQRSAGDFVLRVGNVAVERDFLHVLDVIHAYELVLRSGQVGSIYNVASGQGHSVKDIIDRLSAVSGRVPTISVDPSLLRPVETMSLVGDADKLQALGWEMKHPFESAIEEVYHEAAAAL